MKKTTVLLCSFLIAGTMGLFAQAPQGQERGQEKPHNFIYGYRHPGVWWHPGQPNGNVGMPPMGPSINSNGDVSMKPKTFKDMREEQVAFFNKFIGLTPAEAELFWPIVDDIRAQRWQINRETRQLLHMREDVDFEKTNKRIIELKAREAELERDCYNRLRKVLSPEKLYRYYQADEAYYRNMLRDFGGHGKK